jgi:hypothetical protein
MLNHAIAQVRKRRQRLRKRLRDWATDDLQTGDLKALGAFASHQTKPKDDTLRRLFNRNFVSVRAGEIIVTFRGRAALMIRRSMF